MALEFRATARSRTKPRTQQTSSQHQNHTKWRTKGENMRNKNRKRRISTAMRTAGDRGCGKKEKKKKWGSNYASPETPPPKPTQKHKLIKVIVASSLRSRKALCETQPSFSDSSVEQKTNVFYYTLPCRYGG